MKAIEAQAVNMKVLIVRNTTGVVHRPALLLSLPPLALSESTGGQFETSQFGNRGMWLTGISMAKKINMAAAVRRAVLCSGFLKWRLRFKRTLARLYFYSETF